MMSLENFKEYLPQQLVSRARQYLLEDHTISISENDEGCYDTVIREGGAEHWVGVTLARGTEDVIEDGYCSKCNSLFCVHTVVVLQLISENTQTNGRERSNNKRPSN